MSGLVAKNEGIIAQKREKLEEEVRIIKQQKGAQLVHLGLATEEQALQLKQFQLTIQEFTERANVQEIHERLQAEKQKLCPACQASLSTSTSGCNREFRQFVLCDMLRQAIQEVGLT